MWNGEKINLCAISGKHEAYFYEMINDMEIQRNADMLKYPTSNEKIKGIITQCQERNSEYKYWFVIENKEGNPVGDLDINEYDYRNGYFKYGISILSRFRKLGYAREAIRMVINYYFNEIRFNKVNVEINSFNDASIRLHESMGFKKEGQIRSVLYVGGNYYDKMIYGMLRDEYNEIEKNQ